MSKIIVSGVNESLHYQECMRVLLTSLRKNYKDCIVSLMLINCTDGYEKKLHKIHPYLNTVRREIPNCGAVARINAKHELVYECMEQNDKVLWLDNDILVRGNIDVLWQGVKNDTLKVWIKDVKQQTHKFQAGVYVAGRGKHVNGWMKKIINHEKEYLNTSDSELDGHGSPYWMLSQNFLYFYFNEDKKIKHIQLEEKYNDCKFNKDSVIWHCKNSHFADEIYQREYQKYLKISKEICND